MNKIALYCSTFDLVPCTNNEDCPKEKPYCNCIGRCDPRNQSECATGSVSFELYYIFITWLYFYYGMIRTLNTIKSL